MQPSNRFVLCARAACVLVLSVTFVTIPAAAQAPSTAAPQAPSGRAAPPPAVVSPEVLADRRIAFRIFAPQAQAIRLSAGDIPLAGQSTQLTKGDNGVWEITIGPIDPGAYRYTFNVDGVPTIDPRNPATSESNTTSWSLVLVPGSDLTDTRNVPHGAIAEVTYHSTALGVVRRMHVYTPPGYEAGTAKYPVLYLLHGAGDTDDAWTSVGRAGAILDNLIASGKAKPMLVVMPAGHTSRGTVPGGIVGRTATDAFVNDFTGDVVPYVEKHYRVLTDRAHTAIAGLSMGGTQTLHIAIPRLQRFAYIGVFSSGLIGAFPDPSPQAPAAPSAAGERSATQRTGPPSAAEWAAQHAAMLDNASLRKELKLLWFATGKEDRLITTSRATVDLLRSHGLNVVYEESAGGHTWINWRAYLAEFAPQLFQPAATRR